MKIWQWILVGAIAGTIMVPMAEASRHQDPKPEQLIIRSGQGLVFGALLGALWGCASLLVNRIGSRLSPEDLPPIHEQLNLACLEAVPANQFIAALDGSMPFRDFESAFISNVVHGRYGAQDFYVAEYDTPEGYPLVLLVFPNAGKGWPDFAIYLQNGRKKSLTENISPLQRFAHHYVLLSKRHCIDLTSLRTCFLPDAILEYFASEPEWSVRVQEESVCIWKQLTWGLSAKNLPDLLSQSLTIQELFAKTQPSTSAAQQ